MPTYDNTNFNPENYNQVAPPQPSAEQVLAAIEQVAQNAAPGAAQGTGASLSLGGAPGLLQPLDVGEGASFTVLGVAHFGTGGSTGGLVGGDAFYLFSLFQNPSTYDTVQQGVFNYQTLNPAPPGWTLNAGTPGVYSVTENAGAVPNAVFFCSMAKSTKVQWQNAGWVNSGQGQDSHKVSFVSSAGQSYAISVFAALSEVPVDPAGGIAAGQSAFFSLLQGSIQGGATQESLPWIVQTAATKTTTMELAYQWTASSSGPFEFSLTTQILAAEGYFVQQVNVNFSRIS